MLQVPRLARPHVRVLLLVNTVGELQAALLFMCQIAPTPYYASPDARALLVRGVAPYGMGLAAVLSFACLLTGDWVSKPAWLGTCASLHTGTKTLTMKRQGILYYHTVVAATMAMPVLEPGVVADLLPDPTAPVGLLFHAFFAAISVAVLLAF